MRFRSWCSVWVTKDASSAKSISLMSVSRIFVLAFSRERLNNLPSDLVWQRRKLTTGDFYFIVVAVYPRTEFVSQSIAWDNIQTEFCLVVLIVHRQI